MAAKSTENSTKITKKPSGNAIAASLKHYGYIQPCASLFVNILYYICLYVYVYGVVVDKKTINVCLILL